MGLIIAPTNGGIIRNDLKGFGYWKAPRGSRKHKGIDFGFREGMPKIVLSPVSGIYTRAVRVYEDTAAFTGAVVGGY